MSSTVTKLSTSSVSRPTAGLLASGAYAALMGVVLLFPITLNTMFAVSDDSMSNFFFGAPFFLIGSTLLIASLAGLGLSLGITVLLAVCNLLLVPLLFRQLAYLNLLNWSVVVFTMAAETGVLLAASLLLAVTHKRALAWAPPSLLGVACAALVALVYALNVFDAHRFVTQNGCCGVTPIPKLDTPLLALSYGLLPAIFLIGLFFGRTGGHASSLVSERLP
jgi:hypothetical protein